jgi:signal transduction histidine kinase
MSMSSTSANSANSSRPPAANARVLTGALLALVVGAIGVWQSQRHGVVGNGGYGPSGQIIVAALMAVAAGCYRLLPAAALALVWTACAFQVWLGLPIAIVQLAVVFVSYGTARYGQSATVWLSGLSIPVGSAIALAYVNDAHGAGDFDSLGSALSPSGTPSPTTAFLFALIVLAGPWAAGLLLRITAQWREASDERERAEVEAARAQEIAHLREEQTRVARDVHDIVGHSLAVILAQADSAQYMDDGDVARIRAALANISTSARQSLGDVRQVLSTTRESDGGTPRTGGGLDGLIDGVRSAGYSIATESIGTPRSLPPELDAVAFRVLQEMLTNALKHGSRGVGETCDITVVREWGEHNLRLAVRNPVDPDAVPAPTGGLGLVGMARRLESVGGRLSAGTSRSPTEAEDVAATVFTATAWVPLRDQGGRR